MNKVVRGEASESEDEALGLNLNQEVCIFICKYIFVHTYIHMCV